MGTWGPALFSALFSDDVAADLRNDFRDLIGEGVTPDEATRRLMEEYQPDDPDDGPVFWLALAATQWKLGRLLAHVRTRAVAVIDSGENLARWEGEASASDVRKRRAVLVKLCDQLLSPQPLPRRVKRPSKHETPYAAGDILAYTLRSGRVAVLRVTTIHRDAGGTMPVVEVVDWSGDGMPTPAEIETLPAHVPTPGRYPLAFGKHTLHGHAYTRNMIARWSQREDPSPRLRVLARGAPIPDLPPLAEPGSSIRGVGVGWWRDLDQHLSVIFGLE